MHKVINLRIFWKANCLVCSCVSWTLEHIKNKEVMYCLDFQQDKVVEKLSFQSCVLYVAGPSGPWHLTFASGQQENH